MHQEVGHTQSRECNNLDAIWRSVWSRRAVQAEAGFVWIPRTGRTFGIGGNTGC